MKRTDMFCKCCGQMTNEGNKQNREEYRTRAIWGTDFKKPLSQLIDEVRNQISNVRGKLTDITYGYDCTDGYRLIKDVEGLMTCALVTLHSAREERLKHEVMMIEEEDEEDDEEG